MARGNGRMRIFFDECDYRKFFYVLADVLDTYDIECWDVCAMTNHFHLALWPNHPNISQAMQHLNGEFAGWWNREHRTVGHVYQGRFKAQIVQDDDYVRTLTRYIALNPVRAGLVTAPEAWPWSSYRHIAGLAPAPPYLMPDRVLARFGPGELDVVRQRYRNHILSMSAEEDARIERFRSRQRIIGDRKFKQAVLADSGRTQIARADADLALPGFI
jgi:REP element-mobilizing transposase RayT